MRSVYRYIAYNRKGFLSEKVRNLTWKDFNQCKANKKLLLINPNMEKYTYFHRKYGHKYKIDAVLEVTYRSVGKVLGDNVIGHISELQNYDPDDYVALVLDWDKNNDISDILDQYHAKYMFNFFCLESNRAKYKLLTPFIRFWHTKMTTFGTIKGAIVKRYYRTDNKKLRNQTWHQFNKCIKDKKLILFGIGAACNDFLNLYPNKYRFEFAVDNGRQNWGTLYCGIPVKSPEELNRLDKDNIVVLITSTAHYNPIARQLEDMGIKHYYSFCIMETAKLYRRVISPFIRLQDNIIQNYLYYLFRVFPIQNNKITIIRHNGLGFGCHEKYIALKLLEDHVPCKIIWFVNDMQEEFPKGIKKVKYTPLKKAFHMTTARLWINDGMMTQNVKKRKGQFYLNTLHGVGISLKKFGLDAPNFLSQGQINGILNDAKLADVYLAGSQFISEVYKTAFATKCRIWISGSPRIDVLLKDENTEIKKRLCRFYHIPENAKILLYAPTFRTDRQVSQNKANMDLLQYNLVNYERLTSVLKNKFGGDWYICMRFHPMARKLSDSMEYKGNVVNVSYHPDAQELLAISDAMIVDYSSIMFDMSYAKKPVFIYAPDLKEYTEKERGLYFTMQELPFPIAETESDLFNNIHEFNQEEYENAMEAFMKPLGVFEDGHASERVADFIKEILGK